MGTLERHNVKISGTGQKSILFAHGFGCDQNMWRFVAPNFESNYRVILFDLMGAGKSDKKGYSPLRYGTLQAYADDVLSIARALDLQNAIFVGHSVSCMIGLLAANKEPERFNKLIMVSPSPCYINDIDYHGGFERSDIEGLLESLESNYLGWSSTTAPAIMGNSEHPELAEELTNSFCQMDPEVAKNFARTTFLSDNRADLKKLKTHTLILQCSKDILAPLSVGEYMHTQLQSSKLVVMNATGHCPNLSAPKETTSEIESFLLRSFLQ